MKNNLSWSSFGITDVGKVRHHNEDAMLDKPETGLWVVADGMGGHEDGRVASQMIVRSLDQIGKEVILDKFIDDIEDRLIEINAQLIEKVQKSENKTMIGSTVVGMLAHDKFCTFFWAGDSRLYRMRDSSLRQMSTDHSQVESYIEQGLISREEAIVHPKSNVITRAVGAAKDLYVDFDIQEMQANDRYMLCSDGLTKHLQDREFEIILREGSAEETCKKLIDLTNTRGAHDNVTSIIIDIKSNEH